MKKALFFLAIPIILISCKKETTKPEEEEPASTTAIDLIDNSKGFHRIYRFFEAGVPSGSTIKAVDMTTEGSNRLNVAFLMDANNSVLNRSLSRFSVDYTNNTELRAVTAVPINWTTYFEGEFFQFAPYSDLLAYGYYHGGSGGTYYITQGDIQEPTGMQTHIGPDGRIAKYPHLVVNPYFFSNGITGGDVYGYASNGAFKCYTDYISSSFNKSIFEPISGTNDGVLISFYEDSVSAFIRDLTDTVSFHATQTSSVTLSQNSLSLVADIYKVTIVKNNETDNNFSFAIVGVTPSDVELIVLTFKYDYATKTITKVVDKGAYWKSEVLAYDIDSEGNFYCIKQDKSIYKTTANGTTKIADNILLAGTPSLLKHYNNKLFLGITNVNNNRQLDIVVQD